MLYDNAFLHEKKVMLGSAIERMDVYRDIVEIKYKVTLQRFLENSQQLTSDSNDKDTINSSSDQITIYVTKSVSVT